MRNKRLFFKPPALFAAVIAVLFSVCPTVILAQEVVGERSDSCIACHELMGGKYKQLVADFKKSVHWAKGFGCIDCHGGDPTSNDVAVAMNPAVGFIGKPDKMTIVNVCTKCHADAAYMKKYGNLRTDQLEMYKTSVHGMRLFQNADTNVAVCGDCHSPHLVVPSSNPLSSTNKDHIPETCGKCHANAALMSQYGIPSTVVDDYMAGRHGQLYFKEKETAAPVCTSCHGYHGATPPGIDSIVNVCGTCHLRTEQFYAEGKHNEAFKKMRYPRCLTCHDNHKLETPTDSLFQSTGRGGCLSCHDTKSSEYSTILAIKASLDDISQMHDEAGSLVMETEQVTHLSMSDMQPKVDDIRTKLLSARGIQHAADLKDIEKNQDEAQKAFDEIKKFTMKLIERGASAKRTVFILGALVFAYGLLMLYYTKVVLRNR